MGATRLIAQAERIEGGDREIEALVLPARGVSEDQVEAATLAQHV